MSSILANFRDSLRVEPRLATQVSELRNEYDQQAQTREALADIGISWHISQIASSRAAGAEAGDGQGFEPAGPMVVFRWS